MTLTPNPNDLLKTLGLDGLSPEEKTEALALIDKRLHDAVMNTVLASLSDQEFAEFKALSTGPDAERAVAEFVAVRPDLSAAITARLDDEYRLLKEVMA